MQLNKKQKEFSSKSKNLFCVLATALCVYCAIHFAKECNTGIIRGLTFCITVLIPSLFVFLVLASYISNSTVALMLAKPFSFVTQRILRLPKISSVALILSLIGGYPVGARSVYSLYKSGSISKTQAQKLSLIAISSGPGFVINYVGVGLLGNKKAGVILLVSQIVSFIFVAIIVGRFVKADTQTTKNSSFFIERKNGGSLVEAVESGCNATINMCAMVIIFSAIIAITDTVFYKYPVLCDAITCVLEVTTACNRICTRYPLHIVSFCIGFSGLCVHFQIHSALKELKVSNSLFFLFRIIQGIISGCTTYILLILFPVASQTFSSVEKASGTFKAPLWGCVALMITAVCFLNSVSKVNLKRR